MPRCFRSPLFYVALVLMATLGSFRALAQQPVSIAVALSPTSPGTGAETVTATLTSSGAPVHGGTVLLCSAATNISTECTGASFFGSLQVPANGVVTFRAKTFFSPSAQTFTVFYLGDATYQPAVYYANVSGGSTTTFPTTTTLTASGSTAPYTLLSTVSGGETATRNASVSLTDATTGADITSAFTANGATSKTTLTQGPVSGSTATAFFAATGDINGDGIPDVVEQSGAAYNVYLGKGDGTFAAAVNNVVVASSTPGGVSLADVNNDGILDLVLRVSVSGSTSYYVALGKGNGTFNTPVAVTGQVTSTYSATPLLADMNNDGILDLVYVSFASPNYQLSVATGKGDGTFNAPTNTPLGTTTFTALTGAMAITDLNSDGVPDVVLGRSDKNLVELLSNGQGGFAETDIPLSANLYTLAVIDNYAQGPGCLSVLGLNGVNNSSANFVELDNLSCNGQLSAPMYTPISAIFLNASSIAVAAEDQISPASSAYVNVNGTVLTFQNNNVGQLLLSNTQTFTTNAYDRFLLPMFDFNGDGLLDFALIGQSPNPLNSTANTVYSYTGSAPGGGTRTIKATYAGDSNNLTSASATVTVTGTPLASVLSLTSSAATVAANGTVTLTATPSTANAYGNAFNGTVTFQDGSTTICSAVALTSGSATCTTPALAAGTHSFTATYGADTNFNGSTAKTQVRSGAALATTTSIGASANSVTAGVAVTLTATVKDSTGAAITGGQVKFCNAAAASCTGVNLLGTVTVRKATGTAVLTLLPGGGSHSYTASFVGDVYDTASSAATPVTVNVTSSNATVTTLAKSGNTGNYTLTGTVTGQGAVGETGTVNFLDTSNSNAVVATAQLGTATAGALSYGAAVTSSTCYSVVLTADFNNDGKLDKLCQVYGQQNNGNIIFTDTVLLGNGDGTFAAPVTIASNVGPGLYAADVNNDGKLDIIVQQANGASNQASPLGTVFLGNGDGTFAAGTTAYGYIPSDVNGDGFMDLVSGNSSVSFGNGDGTFQPARGGGASQPGSYNYFIDVNGDGVADTVSYNPNTASNSLVVSLGKGDGTYGTAVQSTLNTSGEYFGGLYFTDVDKDGKLDILALSSVPVPPNYTSYTNNVRLVKGLGTGAFGTQTTLVSGVASYSPGTLAVGDLNNDGTPDFVLRTDTYNASSNVRSFAGTAYTGKGDGTFNVGTTLPIPAVAIADVNGDGLNDLIGGLAAGSTSGANASALASVSQTATATATGVSVSGGGSHNVVANYTGDSGYTGSTSTSMALTGSPTATTTTIATSNTAPAYGQAVTLTATVAPATVNSVNATGTVSFLVDGAALSGCTAQALSGGKATCTTAAIPAGPHSVSASYSGDTNFGASSTVTAATVTVSQGTATLTASAPAITFGTATDTLSASVTYSGTTAPTGAVTFTVDGGAALTATCTGSTSPRTCTYSYNSASLTAGSHNVVASLAADQNYAAATSATATLTVNKATPTLTTAAPATITYGTASTTLSTTLAYTPSTAPTGAVTFTVDGGAALTATCTTGTSPRTCTYTLNTAALAAGSHAVVASYAADTNYNAATAASVTLTVNKQTPALTAAGTTISYGTAADALSATFSFTGGGAVPTGSITLRVDGGTAVTATCSGSASPITCSYSYPAGTLAGGTHTVQAAYAGDGNYVAVTSATANFSVTQQTPTVAVSAPAISYGTASDTLTATVTFTGSGAVPSGAVTFSIDGGAAQAASCTGTTSPRSCTLSLNTATLAGGNHTVVATSAADANYAAATGSATLSVTQAATGTALFATQPSGGGVVLTASITGVPGSYSSGTVTFYDTGSVVCSAVQLSNAGATCATPTLASGTHSFTATYSGDANFTGSNDNGSPRVITIDPATNTNGGSTPPGASTAPVPVSLGFGSSFTLGSINLTNSGSTTQPFMVVSGGTCSVGTAYAAGQSCTVNVVFTNSAPGLVIGNLALLDNTAAANVVGTATVAALGSR